MRILMPFDGFYVPDRFGLPFFQFNHWNYHPDFMYEMYTIINKVNTLFWTLKQRPEKCTFWGHSVYRRSGIWFTQFCIVRVAASVFSISYDQISISIKRYRAFANIYNFLMEMLHKQTVHWVLTLANGCRRASGTRRYQYRDVKLAYGNIFDCTSQDEQIGCRVNCATVTSWIKPKSIHQSFILHNVRWFTWFWPFFVYGIGVNVAHAKIWTSKMFYWC